MGAALLPASYYAKPFHICDRVSLLHTLVHSNDVVVTIIRRWIQVYDSRLRLSWIPPWLLARRDHLKLQHHHRTLIGWYKLLIVNVRILITSLNSEATHILQALESTDRLMYCTDKVCLLR